MENPATWGEEEHVINRVLNTPPEVLGLSLERRITEALRTAGLLRSTTHQGSLRAVTRTRQPGFREGNR